MRALEDDLLKGVSAEALMRATAEISKGVRLSGSPEELESLRWLEAELQGHGFATHLLHHPAYISLPGRASLAVEGEPAALDCITHSFAVATPRQGVTAPLVHVPDPASAGDLTGCIALIPGMASPGAVRRVETLGAVGQVFIHDDHLHESALSPVWGSPTDETTHLLPVTPSVSIRRGDGERLARLLKSSPVQVTLTADVQSGWRDIPLLTADLMPADDDAADFVLFSGHIDSWHLGAMDNGSANATMLEIGRLLAPHRAALRRGLRLAFWSGHSHGRYAGSAWYADHYWQELDARCVAHVNVDSLGGKDAVVVTESPVMPQTKGLAAAALARVTGEVFEGKRIARFADQSFYGLGVNSVYGTLSEQEASRTEGQIRVKFGPGRGGGLGWWWHTPEDTLDKLDPSLLVRDCQIYLATIVRLLCEPVLPFDYRPSVREIQEVVAELVSALGPAFDFSPLPAELAALAAETNRIHAALDNNAALAPEHLKAANTWMKRVSRHLVRVAFHENGPHYNDLMAALAPVPALQQTRALLHMQTGSAEAHHLRVRLRRRFNWVLQEIQAARQACQGVPIRP